jgi:threonine/homoserine/homoserine lactone efflux protein
MTLALVSIFSSSFLLAFSGAMMPGPLLTVTVSESTRQGAVTGPLLILGHGILELALVAALLAGLAPFLSGDAVFIVVSLVGGSFLLWMAWSMFRSLPQLRLDQGDDDAPSRNLVLSGVLLSIANPYWLIWWATIGLGYVLHSMKLGVPGVSAFFTGHILADLAWYWFVSFGIARGSHLLGDRSYRVLIGTCAVFLVLLSAFFLYSGIGRLV